MMNENEINRILNKTKEKIAISQFKEERVDEMKHKKNSSITIIKRIGITTVAGMLLTVGSVGAYVGITGNYEILRNIGINIGEKYEEEKQKVEALVKKDGASINLVSAACDSSCIILEMNVKLDDKYKNIDFEIDKLTLEGGKRKESTDTGLNLSESIVSSIMEDGTIKLFKYISVKDPNLAGDGYLDEVFRDNNKAKCMIEFSKIIDTKTKEVILEGNWEFNFDLIGKENSEYIFVNKNIKLEDVSVDVVSIAKSLLGNYISVVVSQDNFDVNKENNIQKLEYSIKNSKGENVNIVSKTYNITCDAEDPSKIGVEVTLKLDDTSKDVNYDINAQIGKTCNISTKEITDVIERIETKKQEKEIVKEDKNEEIQMTVIEKEENNQSNLDFIVSLPLKRDLIILRRFDDEAHEGIDLMAEEGELIYAVNDGKVLDAGYSEKEGKYITIEHSNGFRTMFAACSELLKGEGDEVKAGDAIAKVGSTGMSTGPHLHFEIRDYNIYKNPEDYLK